MADHGITIRWYSSHYVSGVHDGVRVRIEAVCATNMATKVFAYRMLPLNPQTGATAGHFSHVCSPPDLEEYPEDEPSVGSSPEWFRLDYVDVLVRSVEEAEEFIEIVRSHVLRLKTTLDQADTLVPGGTDTIGTACEDEVESVSSSSSSASSASLGLVTEICAVGTSELSTGVGIPWVSVGIGAGSPIGSSDSAAKNISRAVLPANSSSQLLLVQGYDFNSVPDDAIITGLSTRTVIRDATDVGSSVSDSSASSESATPCPQLCFLALQHPDFGLGTNKALFECIDGPEWQDLYHGNVSDLWGFSELRGRDLKRGAFGMSLVVASPVELESTPVEVDGVEVCVFYQEEF